MESTTTNLHDLVANTLPPTDRRAQRSRSSAAASSLAVLATREMVGASMLNRTALAERLIGGSLGDHKVPP